MAKVCKICLMEKELDNFYIRNNNKHRNECKSCFNIKEKERYINNKEYKINKSSEYYYKHRVLKIKQPKVKKVRILKTKEQLKQNVNNYRKNKYHNDILYKMKIVISTQIGRNINKNKESCSKYLPYTMQELKSHLESLFESWMTWNNYGRYDKQTWNDQDNCTWTWQLDHIIPQSEFLYKDMKEDNFKKCWELSNLRPYSAKLNIIEGSLRVRHKKEK
jgi:hypothetical protein